jgi:hypothetical protein
MTKEKGSLLTIEAISSICTDCVTLMGALTLEYPDGSLANVSTGVYNHHVIVLNLGKTQHMMVCPGASVPRVPSTPGLFLGGASDDTVALFTPNNKAVKTGPNDTLILVAEVMNYRPQRQDIYIVAEAEWIQGSPQGYLDTITLPISVGSCNSAEFMITQDRYNQSSGDWIVPADGYIITMRKYHDHTDLMSSGRYTILTDDIEGHLHDGGDLVVAELNDKVICKSMATYSKVSGSGGHAHGDSGMRKAKRRARDLHNWERRDEVGLESISHMEKCTEVVPIKKGDKLRVTAYFDLVKHPL